MSGVGGKNRVGMLRMVAGVMAAILVLAGWATAPDVSATASTSHASGTEPAPFGGNIAGASGSTAVPNFVLEGERQVLIDDAVTWTWTAPHDGNYVFNTHGSEMDTQLETQSLSAGTSRTSDDTGDVSTSEVAFDASEGERVRIQVRAENSDTGVVSLAWHEEGAASATQPPAASAASGSPLIPASTNTGEKPQSKAWRHDGAWWVVLASTSTQVPSAGTWLWRLDGDGWTPQLRLSSATDVRADTFPDGDVTHVLLHGDSSTLVSIQYDGSGYQPWADRTTETGISMSGSETATLTVDSTDRMWVAYDTGSDVMVRHSVHPYTSFSAPIPLASGIGEDDIAVITSLTDGRIGVMWSNQSREQFGFRVHEDGASPDTWADDEASTAGSELAVGDRVADDHLNVAVASDGTLYAAVKTSYDATARTVIGLLVRQPDGTWDPMHEVAQYGTRPIVVLDETNDTVRVVFTESVQFDNILMRTSSRQNINFSGAVETVLAGGYNNVTSAKAAGNTAPIVLAATESMTVKHAFLGDTGPEPEPEPVPEGPVGVWDFSEGSGTVVGDASGQGNNGTVVGSPTWIDGVAGPALRLSGSDHVRVPHSSSVNLSGRLTMAAWVRPELKTTQYVLKKAAQGATDGYEIGLASTGTVFARMNQASSGNDFRVDSTSQYPVDGSTWMHVAAVVDSTHVRLYINGVEQATKPAPASVGTNALDLTLGAEPTGNGPLTGGLDQVRLHSGALTAQQIAELAADAPEPDPEPQPVPEGPVGVWDFSEGSGSVAGDTSGQGNNGALVGSPTWIDGVAGPALRLGGSDHVRVPHSTSVNLSGPLTMAAWIRPEKAGTQYVLKKAAQGSADGYEIGLSNSGLVFARVNQASSGNAFRVDSTSPFPVDGATWMHVAAVVDASTVRLYINGVEQGSVPAPASVGTNALDLFLGAGDNGNLPLMGSLDQVRLHSGALTAQQIADLAANEPEPEPEPEWPFLDVTPETTAFVEEIRWLKEQGITTGYPDGNFGPKDRISREAMAAFFYRMAGEPEVTGDPEFTDVDGSSKFAKEIAWLQDEGITTGHPDGRFGPKERISREAMAAFMTRYVLDGPPPKSSAPYAFSDIEGTAFADHIAWLADEGITNGYPNGKFGPRDRISREAVAAFLYRARHLTATN